MTYPQYYYLTLTFQTSAIIALLYAVINLVQMISPRQLPSRSKQLKGLLVGACFAGIVWGAHYLYSDWYFWPQFVQDQQKRGAANHQRDVLIDKHDVIPKIEISTIDGEKIVLGGKDENVVVLNFFATWCNPCVQELPELERSWNYFKNFPQIKFVVVGCGQDVETIRKFRDEKKLTLPFAVDPDESLFHKFVKAGIPVTFIVLPDGTIAFAQHGYGGGRLDHLNARLDILTLMRDSSHGLVSSERALQQDLSKTLEPAKE